MSRLRKNITWGIPANRIFVPAIRILAIEGLTIRLPCELALDTAVPATHLIDRYKRLGYRTVAHYQRDVTNYRSVIMSKEVSAGVP